MESLSTLLNGALGFGHTALSFIVIISIIVFIHELGHYSVARLCGVKIEAFAIGFGKELFGWNDRHGTRWKICVAPLGGYVKMYGDASEASTPNSVLLDKMSESERKISFHFKSLWQKTLIVAAGPAANFILAIIIFTGLIMANGIDTTEPQVGTVMEGSAAQDAGLEEGDRVLRVDGKEISKFGDIPTAIASNLGDEVALLIRRDGQEMTIRLTPRMDETEDALGNKIKRPLIGISSPRITADNVGFGGAVLESCKRIWDMITLSIDFLGQVITGSRSTEELKGPIGIADLSGKATQQDFYTIIWFMALISVNLGFVNILPIPPLDGGHILFYGVEAVAGQGIAERIQEWGYRVGFIFIIGVMGFTIFNDIRQLL